MNAKSVAPAKAKAKKGVVPSVAKFPRHAVEKALRVPTAIIEQNAGKACTERDSAKFVGVGYNGPYRVEVSSSIKFGFLERPSAGSVAVTERARQAIRPQNPEDKIKAFRDAVTCGAGYLGRLHALSRGKLARRPVL